MCACWSSATLVRGPVSMLHCHAPSWCSGQGAQRGLPPPCPAPLPCCLQTSDVEQQSAALPLLGLAEERQYEIADSFDAEAPAAAAAAAAAAAERASQQEEVVAPHAPRQREQEGGACAAPDVLMAQASGSLGSEGAGGGLAMPEPVGLVLLHPGAPCWLPAARPAPSHEPRQPRLCCRLCGGVCRVPAACALPPPLASDLAGNSAPKYARVLAHSRLGRRVLRR